MMRLQESSLSSTCVWRFYKQLNSIPENPAFKAFGSPVEFYGLLKLMRM